MKNSKNHDRNGLTLLELIVTTAMLAALTSSCMVIVRTSYTAWNRHEEDHATRQAGLAVLKHIVRQTRQAKAAFAISLATDNSGSLTLLHPNGNLLVWEHDMGNQEVRFGVTTATDVLAHDIAELTFVGYKVDGITPTTKPGLIHLVKCTTKVNVIRPSGSEAVTNSCQAWLRAW